MEFLLVITYAAFFIFLIRKMSFFEAPGISKTQLTGIFLFKILAGVSLWAVYTFYYTDRSTADIYKYFDDSGVIYNALRSNPLDYLKMLSGIGNDTPAFDGYYAEMHYWARKPQSGIYNDSHTIIRFNAFVRLFSFGYFNVHTVVICFLSFCGLTAIYKTFQPHLQGKSTLLAAAVFLLPSVMFWGSGVLKEGLILFALGVLIHAVNRFFSLRAVITALLTGALLALSKFYVWLAILPGLLFLIWSNRTQHSRPFLKFFFILLIIAVAGLNIDRFSSIQNPLVTLSQKQLEFRSLATGNEKDAFLKPIAPAGSFLNIPNLEPTLSSFIRNSPQALSNVLFRPFIWESFSPFMLMAAIENILMIAFVILCIIFCKAFKEVQWSYFLFCFSFVIIQFLIIGETTPVIGAIVRYKVPALPFLLIAFLFLLDSEKLLKRAPKLRRFIG